MPNETPEDAMGGGPGALPTFGQADTFQYARPLRGIDPAAGQALANVAGGLARQFGGLAQRANLDIATRQGQQAGMDPNYRPDADESPDGIAYRNAAVRTYGNQVEIQARGSADQAWQQYQNQPPAQQDPAQLQANLAAIHQDMSQNHLFPSVQPQFDGAWSRISQGYLDAAQTQQRTRAVQANNYSTLLNLNSAHDATVKLASLPGTSDDAVQSSLAQSQAAIAAAVQNGNISGSGGARMTGQLRDNVGRARAVTSFMQLSPDQRPAALAAYQDGVPNSVPAAGAYIYGLERQAGWDPVHAAVLAGNIQRESNFNPASTNPKEGGAGLFTFEGPRLPALQAFAAANGQNWQNAATQVAFQNHEMATTEKTAGDAFRAATNLGDANQALKGYIRYGDNSDDVRLQNAEGFMGKGAFPISPVAQIGLTRTMQAQVHVDGQQPLHMQKVDLADIASMQKQEQGGYPVSDAEWAQKGMLYQGSDNPLVSQSFAQALAIHHLTAGFRGQAPDQITSELDDYDAANAKQGWNAHTAAISKAGHDYADQLRQDLASHPFSRAARDGGLPMASGGASADVLPLDFSSPAALSQSLNQRQVMGDQIAETYHMATPPLATAADKEAMKQVFAQGGEPALQAAAAIGQAFGPKAGDYLRQIGGVSPQFTQMARIANSGDPAFLRDAAWSLQQDHVKGARLPGVRASDMQAAVTSTFGGALSALGDAAPGAVALANNASRAQMMRDGQSPDAVIANLHQNLQKSVGATYDGSTRYGGVDPYAASGYFAASHHVLLPSDMKSGSLPDVMGAVTDQDLAGLPNPPLYGNGKPFTADDLRSARLTSLGPGVYAVSLGDPQSQEPMWVTTAKGGQFVLDLNAMRNSLAKRVPDAYRNGGR